MSPGIRMRMMRVILGMSRELFCARYKVNFHTYTSIELDRLKISPRQLTKIINAFAQEGLYTTKEWLMDGRGEAPSRVNREIVQPKNFLEQWVCQFFSQSRNTLLLNIKDDAMEPFYSKGDLVGGAWNQNPQELLGKRCIVYLEGQLHVGTLFQFREMFSLVPSNNASFHAHTIFHAACARMAEIIFHIKNNAHKIPELSALEAGALG